ncbi:poly(rC)-binding protein 3, partial [Diaphorina citri]|uniref:Poly(RC)-binding protein 3 n=1 Tax=Diaphorina citri TaxID=121845 RepID=A0A1S3DEU7_DIACI
LLFVILFQEVGSIIGKKGEIVKRFREESGAKINISDGSCPERVVTVTGTTTSLLRAFALITKKFEEFHELQNNHAGTPGTPGNPASVVVTVTGTTTSLLRAFALITKKFEESGAKINISDGSCPERVVTVTGKLRRFSQIGSKLSGSPLAGLTSLGLGGLGSTSPGALNPAALAALAGSQLRTTNPPRTPQPPQTQQTSSQTQEMTVPNDLIGCIIGKGGTKIFEIRQISGAMIRISNAEEREANSTDRTITISGNPDSVALAQYLINMRISMETAGMPMGGYHYLTPNHIVKASIH